MGLLQDDSPLHRLGPAQRRPGRTAAQGPHRRPGRTAAAGRWCRMTRRKTARRNQAASGDHTVCPDVSAIVANENRLAVRCRRCRRPIWAQRSVSRHAGRFATARAGGGMRSEQLQRQRRAWRRVSRGSTAAAQSRAVARWQDNPSDQRVDGYRDAIEHWPSRVCWPALTRAAPVVAARWRRSECGQQIVRRWAA